MRRAALLITLLLGVLLAATLATSAGRNLAWAAFTRLHGRASVEDRLAEFGSAARGRLHPGFEAAGVSYPPAEVALVALKEERRLEVHARTDGAWRLVRVIPIEGASGTLGPKLTEGDGQVPEGVYRIESLNPNSRYHVALRVAYPNEDDLARGLADARGDLGGDIMIHGGRLSIGCIAVGDPAAEELFTLAADVGLEHVELLIAPCDLRTNPPATPLPTEPAWVSELYADLAARLDPLRKSG